MRYLISGHPRTRTAWLCALLNAHGSLCYHDARVNFVPLDIDAGIADPGLACLNVAEALELTEGKPRISIVRDDWREALADWSGILVSTQQAQIWDQHCAEFAGASTLALAMHQLDDNEIVKEVVELCTHKPASPELIKIFQGMQIEQHLPKAQLAMPISRLVSRL
jgi:hypothetical protein